MIFKADMQRIAHGVQTGVEAVGALKSLYYCGQAAFSLGTRLGAAAIPFLL